MLKSLIRVLISLSILVFLFWYFDLSRLTEYISMISYFNLIIAFCLIFTSTFLTSVRFSLIVNALDKNLTFTDIHILNIKSQLFGLIFFSTFGQMFARSQLAIKKSNQAPLFSAITLLEKFLAFGSLSLISILSVAYLFSQSGFISYRLSNISFIFLVFFIVFSIITNYYITFSSAFKRFFKKLLLLILKLKIARQLILNILIHILTLASYIFISSSFDNLISLDVKICLFALVMLGAAIPISFSGWGPRELSAAMAFTIFSGDPLLGVSISIIVGVISIISLISHWIISIIIPKTAKEINYLSTRNFKSHSESIIAFIGMFFIPLLIGLQIRVPTQSNWLTLNLADPIAIMTGITFFTFILRHKLMRFVWRVKNFNLGIICFGMTIIYGLILGIIKFGSNDWALINRTIGLLILFSYLLSGALIANHFKSISYKKVVTIFLYTSFFALAFHNIFLIYIDYLSIKDFGSFSSLFNWNKSYFSGLMQNRNGYSFALIMFFCLSFNFILYKDKLFYLFTFIFFTLMFFTESRTGLFTSLIISNLIILFRDKKFNNLIFVWIIFLISFIFKEIIENRLFIYYLMEFSNINFFNDVFVSDLFYNFETPDNLRIFSYQEGFKVFLSSPFIGSGLGYFIEHSQNIIGEEVIIHNTMLWILTEMGLIGLIVFSVLPVIIIFHLYKSFKNGLKTVDIILLFIILSSLIYSQAHEIIYQRIFWFAIGFVIVNQNTKLRNVVLNS